MLSEVLVGVRARGAVLLRDEDDELRAGAEVHRREDVHVYVDPRGRLPQPSDRVLTARKAGKLLLPEQCVRHLQ